MNQVGTLTEALESARIAFDANWECKFLIDQEKLMIIYCRSFSGAWLWTNKIQTPCRGENGQI